MRFYHFKHYFMWDSKSIITIKCFFWCCKFGRPRSEINKCSTFYFLSTFSNKIFLLKSFLQIMSRSDSNSSFLCVWKFYFLSILVSLVNTGPDIFLGLLIIWAKIIHITINRDWLLIFVYWRYHFVFNQFKSIS